MRRFAFYLLVVFFPLCSSVFAENSDIDKTIKETGRMYERTYKAIWSQLDMHTKLLEAVHKGFDEQTRDLTWGTGNLQLIFNEKLKADIYESVMFYFMKDYEQFMEKVTDAFGVEVADIVENFYKIKITEELGVIKNPMARGYVRESAIRAINGGLLERTLENLSDSDKKLLGEFAKPALKGAAAIGIFLGRKFIVKAGVKIAQKAGITALAKGVGAKVMAISGPIGWTVLLVWGGMEISEAFWSLNSAPDRMKSELLNTIESRMTTDGIEIQWEEMSPDVKSTFEQIKADIAIYIGLSEKITEHKGLTESSKLLTGEQSEKLGMKLSELQSGGKVDIDILLNNVDRMIREQVASEDSKK